MVCFVNGQSGLTFLTCMWENNAIVVLRSDWFLPESGCPLKLITGVSQESLSFELFVALFVQCFFNIVFWCIVIFLIFIWNFQIKIAPRRLRFRFVIKDIIRFVPLTSLLQSLIKLGEVTFSGTFVTNFIVTMNNYHCFICLYSFLQMFIFIYFLI